MNFFRLGLLSLLLFFLNSCEDDEAETMPATIAFDAVCLTDVNGQPIGGNCTDTAWSMDEVWEEIVDDLFANPSANLCTDMTGYDIFRPYPNPAIDEAFWGLNLNEAAQVELRFVDREYNLLKSIDPVNNLSAGFNNIALDLSDLPRPDTVRLYYKIVVDDCEWRGHGDIVLQN